jgi:hypothetical protein
LIRANAGDGIVDYRFVLPESFTALGANREVFLKPVLFFLAKLA